MFPSSFRELFDMIEVIIYKERKSINENYSSKKEWIESKMDINSRKSCPLLKSRGQRSEIGCWCCSFPVQYLQSILCRKVFSIGIFPAQHSVKYSAVKQDWYFSIQYFCILGAVINHSLYTDQTTPNTLCTILFLFINFMSIHPHLHT